MYTGRKKQKLQGKTSAHKRALMKSQVIELIRNGKIKTTPSKAKALKSTFDRLVTHYKKETNAGNVQVQSFLSNNKRALERLGYIVDTFLKDRNSGYTHLIKTTPRPGDNADQAYVMVVNFEKQAKKSKIQATLEKQKKAKTTKKAKK